MDKNYKFKSEIWLFPSETGAWHFASLPKEVSEDINRLYEDEKRGWGSLPVKVTVGKSTWKTSIFPDKKTGVFMLPIKASIRKTEFIEAGSIVPFSIKIDL